MTEPTSQVMTVTPDQAERWLTLNTHNRPVIQSRVDKLAAAIRRGEWQLNGDAIRFQGNMEVLLDGQHRLWAIFVADQAVDTFVTYGLEAEAQSTMDVGVKRGLSDILALAGDVRGQNPKVVAETVNLFWRWHHGVLRDAVQRPSPAQAQATLGEHPGLYDYMRPGANVYQGVGAGGRAVYVVAYYLFSRVDAEKAKTFMDRLKDGVELGPGSPILALRRSLQKGLGKRTQTEVFAMLIRAWNSYYKGGTLDRVYWNPQSPFPEISGL